MQELSTAGHIELAAKRAAWFKIIEDYNTSGESQTNYCKKRSIKIDHFAYYLGRWRKANSANTPAVSFMEMQVINTAPQDKWILHVANGISLEVPQTVLMPQLKVASMPAQPIRKGIPGPGLLAEVAINKYQDSLPIYRQTQRFERHGIDIAESTLGDWMSQSAQLLSRLVDLMHTDMLRESHLYGDDTPVPVLAVEKNKKSRLWCYV